MNIFFMKWIRGIIICVCFSIFIVSCNDISSRKISKALGTTLSTPDPNCVPSKKKIILSKDIKIRNLDVKLLNEEKKQNILKSLDY